MEPISWKRRLLYSMGAPLLAALFSFVLASIVMAVSGTNPFRAFGFMFENAAQLETIVSIFNDATPLYISAVAAAIGFKMNLFNIGVEGQFLLAAFFAAVVGGAVTLPAILHVPLILLVAMSVGAAYAAIAGLLKVSRNINEVISTIMLNGIAIGGILASLTKIWEDPTSTSNNRGTRVIPESGRLPSLNPILELVTPEIGKGQELSSVIILAVVVGVAYHYFLNRSRLGFDVRASGWNPSAAESSGVPPKRMIMLAMVLSGAIAGLVGMVQLLSDQYKYDGTFPQGLGFLGIAVALLGRNHPVGMVPAALLFGFLRASSGILQFRGATPEIVVIIQGVVLLAAVVAYEIVRRLREADEAARVAAALTHSPVGVSSSGVTSSGVTS